MTSAADTRNGPRYATDAKASLVRETRIFLRVLAVFFARHRRKTASLIIDEALLKFTRAPHAFPETFPPA